MAAQRAARWLRAAIATLVAASLATAAPLRQTELKVFLLSGQVRARA